jgi:hypothetical protein
MSMGIPSNFTLMWVMGTNGIEFDNGQPKREYIKVSNKSVRLMSEVEKCGDKILVGIQYITLSDKYHVEAIKMLPGGYGYRVVRQGDYASDLSGWKNFFTI